MHQPRPATAKVRTLQDALVQELLVVILAGLVAEREERLLLLELSSGYNDRSIRASDRVAAVLFLTVRTTAGFSETFSLLSSDSSCFARCSC